MIHKFNLDEKVFDLELTTYTFLNYQRIFGKDLLGDVQMLQQSASSNNDFSSLTLMIQVIYSCIINPTLDIKGFTSLIPLNKLMDVEFIKYLTTIFTKLFEEFTKSIKTPSK